MLDSGTLAFCGYAALRTDGLPVDPICSLTGDAVRFAPAAGPLHAFVWAYASGFNCFNSSKQARDRLCIPHEYMPSIDCVHPERRAAVLAVALATGERDFRRAHNGRRPQFQCFHRGGYGSVPWLHLHSFDGYADSICPRMSTPWGVSPNPIPHKIVCASGELTVAERVDQMLVSMALGVAGGPTWLPPPEGADEILDSMSVLDQKHTI